MRQIVLDTETTGLSPKEGHRIIEIGCIELVDRRFTGNNFHFYINPERDIDEGAMQVHGISNIFLTNKPFFHEVYPKFRRYVEGAELIIHNAAFDVGFLNHEFALINPENKTVESICSVCDTLTMARKLHPGQRNSLDALCKRYRVDNSNRELHGALLDAELLAKVYLAMTGGQQSMFDSLQNKSNQSKNSTKVEKAIAKKTKWQLANAQLSEEANQSHRQYLEDMAKKTDKVIWQEH